MKSFYQEIDYNFLALFKKLGKNHNKVYLALTILENYINACMIQYLRIQETKKQISQTISAIQHTNNISDIKFMNKKLFLDVHFYLIAGHKVQNMLKKIGDLTESQEVKSLYENNQSYFKNWNDMRNHLEHQEQRLHQKYLINFGNLHNNSYQFGNDSFDIGENNLKKMTSLYENLLTVLQKELV